MARVAASHLQAIDAMEAATGMAVKTILECPMPQLTATEIWRDIRLDDRGFECSLESLSPSALPTSIQFQPGHSTAFVSGDSRAYVRAHTLSGNI